MEDASAVDLDWFWRGWFYTTDHVDVNISAIREYTISSKDPEVEAVEKRRLDEMLRPEPLAQIRNRQEGRIPRLDRVEGLRDFYNENDPYKVSDKQRNDYTSYLENLESWERDVLARAVQAGEYVYFVDFENKGGLLSALPLQLTFADDSVQRYDVPAQIWRYNSEKVTKLLIRPRRLRAIELDPDHQTADVDRSNNYFPRKIMPSRLELYKAESTTRDLMKEMLVELKGKDKTAPDGNPVPLSTPDALR
jgi:hypothetical protein